MWRWLQNNRFNINKRQQFLLSLCCIVLLGHILLGSIFAILSFSFRQKECFVLSSKKVTSTLVLCPLKKKIEKQKNISNNSNNLSSSKVIDYQTYEKEKNRKKSLTVAQVETVSISQKNKTQEEQVKKTTSKAIKKPALKVATISTSSLDTKQEKKVESKEDFEKKVLPGKSKELKKQEEDINVNDVEFIGYEQLDTLATQHKIQQLVQEHFSPPVGMSEGVCSELTVCIIEQGAVSKAIVAKSSGSLVYDNAARTAIYKTIFPKEVWNKTITIILGQ